MQKAANELKKEMQANEEQGIQLSVTIYWRWLFNMNKSISYMGKKVKCKEVREW